MKRKFKIGDLVEWNEGKEVMQGEIIRLDKEDDQNIGTNGVIGDVRMRTHIRQLRIRFYVVLNHLDSIEYVIHEGILRHTKVKVQFNRNIY